METPASRHVRDIVYQTLAEEGRAPSIAEIARLSGEEESEVRTHLNTLAD